MKLSQLRLLHMLKHQVLVESLLTRMERLLQLGGVAPVQLIPEEIVKNQSLSVDNVTGATITSGAIKTAVKDAIKQAGGDPDAFKNKATYEERKDVEADVVVVGGGGAGLASAVELLQGGKSVALSKKPAK